MDTSSSQEKCPNYCDCHPGTGRSRACRGGDDTRKRCSIRRKNNQIKGKFLGEIGHQAPGCCCSVTKSCLTLCNPLNCNTPGLPVPHDSRWCHPTILSSATLFSSSLQSLPTSGSFATSRFFSSGDQSIEASVWWLKESLVVKNRPANAKDPGMTPGLGRSRGGGNGNPLQYSCLGNPTGRGAWGATVHGVTKELDTT